VAVRVVRVMRICMTCAMEDRDSSLGAATVEVQGAGVQSNVSRIRGAGTSTSTVAMVARRAYSAN